MSRSSGLQAGSAAPPAQYVYQPARGSGGVSVIEKVLNTILHPGVNSQTVLVLNGILGALTCCILLSMWLLQTLTDEARFQLWIFLAVTTSLQISVNWFMCRYGAVDDDEEEEFDDEQEEKVAAAPITRSTKASAAKSSSTAKAAAAQALAAANAAAAAAAAAATAAQAAAAAAAAEESARGQDAADDAAEPAEEAVMTRRSSAKKKSRKAD